MRSGVVAAGVVPARNVAAPVVAAGMVRTGSDMAVTRARPAMTSHDGHSEEAGAAEGQREDVGVEHEWDGLKLTGGLDGGDYARIYAWHRVLALEFPSPIGYFWGLQGRGLT
jgi:hypothetical protein